MIWSRLLGSGTFLHAKPPLLLAGIDSGVTMRLAGEGPTDSRTGQAGNILLDIQVWPCMLS